MFDFKQLLVDSGTIVHCRAKLSIGRPHLVQLLAAERYCTAHAAPSVKESVEMAGLVDNLWSLCRSGTLDQVKAALEAGADPNTTGESPQHDWGEPTWTWLMTAMYDKRVDLVDLLLSQPSIDVNAKAGSRLGTALHTACLFFNEAILHKILATPGLLLNERNSTGDTPIMCAVRLGRVGAVKLMATKEQVDLDVKDYEGRSLEEMNPFYMTQVVLEARQRRKIWLKWRRWGEFIIHQSE